jgi:4'-phosphopantetheinyl transferase
MHNRTPVPNDQAHSAMLDIDRDHIHLWFVFPDEIRDEALLQRYYHLMTMEEQRQQSRFRLVIDQRRYLVTRALVRVVLSRYAPIEPRDWVFAANAFGRPAIANVEHRAQCISFNISHTNSLILLGVTCKRALGVDVENCSVRKAWADIADHCFAPEEVAELRALPKARQRERFFEYWTLKECYIKARGMGLSIPLGQFSFRFPTEETLCVSMHPDLNDCPSRWRFWQFRPTACYCAAVCAEHSGVVPRLMVRKVVPFMKEERFEYERLRTSETPISPA